MNNETATRFESWMTQMLDHRAGAVAPDRSADYRALIDLTRQHLEECEGHDLYQRLPRAIQSVFERRGWDWNGIYALDGDKLKLFAAAGPPVCAELDRSGGVGESGMCFDALGMNQTLVTDDPKKWPGYVSCDGESGLQTAAGIVSPIRDDDHRPVAVWDLDAVAPLSDSDPIFMDHYFATLSIMRPYQPA